MKSDVVVPRRKLLIVFHFKITSAFKWTFNGCQISTNCCHDSSYDVNFYFFLINLLLSHYRSPSEHSGRKGCCAQFLHSPKSLGLIAMIALGGVACALGGAAWGASGLSGQPSTHLTMSLLMIGKRIYLYYYLGFPSATEFSLLHRSL